VAAEQERNGACRDRARCGFHDHRASANRWNSVQAAAAVQGTERAKVPVIVLRSEMYSPSFKEPLPDHLQPFRDDPYLHCRNTITFPNGDEIWQRMDK